MSPAIAPERRNDILDLQAFLIYDYSQAELRMLAEISGDKTLIRLFQEAAADPKNPEKDVHCNVGHLLTGWSVQRIKEDKSARKVVKNMQFGLVYGKSKFNMYDYVITKIREQDGPDADVSNITKEFVEHCVDMYFKRFSGVARFMRDAQEAVEKTGKSSTLFGFHRPIFEDEARSTFVGNQAINCVDYETKILTKRGWVRGDCLTHDDYCRTETGWQPPIHIANWPHYQGPVHKWKSRTFSAVSTPEHRWKVYNKDHGKEEIWTSETLPKFSQMGYGVLRTLPILVPEGAPYSDDFVETIEQGHGVWCPTFADDAAWVAQREGSTYITKNSPVQGSAHQLMLIAMALLHIKPRTYNLLQRVVMEVHDALVFFAEVRDLEKAWRQGQHLLEKGVVEYVAKHFKRELKVPLLCEAEVGFCMGSCVAYEGEAPDIWIPKWRAKHAKVEAEAWEELRGV